MTFDGRKNPGIKIPHLSVVNRPIVDGTRCVQVRIPDDDSYMAVLAGLVAIGNQWFNWERDNAHTGALLAQQWRNAYLETVWDTCMNCEELTECLQPLFDALETQIASLSAQVTNLQQVIDNSTTVHPPEPYTPETCTYGHMYNAALQAVEQVNLLISGIYKRAEVEAPDNLAEGAELILSAVPFFETLPFDELFSLSQWAFDNQRATYDADYVAETGGHTWFERAAGVLWCLVKDTCTIDHEVIGMWLSSLDEMFPDNYAAEVFTRFGDATTPTMINQIGEALDSLRGGQSLSEFFDDIIVQFGVGAQSTNPDYAWIDCGFTVLAGDDPTVAPFGQDSGIVLTNGVEITINASGTWSYDNAGAVNADGRTGTSGNPSAVLPAALLGSLIYKVGSGGAWQAGGVSWTFTPGTSGALWLAMNDVGGNYNDNVGELSISVGM